MEEGNFFGEISFLDAAPRSMSVSADNVSLLYRISRTDFYKVFKSQPEITQKIISTLTDRLRKQNENVIRDLRTREAQLSKLVAERTEELEVKNSELSKTLTELKATQEQLIQQEKLASLGQLTAGIAHEIKNPLNFVNNFAKLSFDLVDEIIVENSEEERKEIGKFLRQNLEKIHGHGSRADSIVKGMLEHTRTGGGTKQATDINKLCDQFVNLSYVGLSDNSQAFQACIELNLDKDLPMIEAYSADISKMLLNVFNNAFYAVREKVKSNPANYSPKVTVSTSVKNKNIFISVEDNGTGIPAEIINQIFNPFFTTKPTGDGAGLGLSISNDIVKAHRGSIRCTSEIGQGSTFEISIPAEAVSSN
jgi:two-component system, NtrC family, sensor kinase